MSVSRRGGQSGKTGHYRNCKTGFINRKPVGRSCKPIVSVCTRLNCVVSVKYLSLLFSRCFYILRVCVVFTQENSSIKQFAPHTITCDTIPPSTDNLRQVRLNFMTLLLSVTVCIFRCFVFDQCFLAPSWITNCFPPRRRLRPSDKFLPVLNVAFFIILLQVETAD